MEKGPSTYAEYWTSEYAEVEHYKRHGKQMGFEFTAFNVRQMRYRKRYCKHTKQNCDHPIQGVADGTS